MTEAKTTRTFSEDLRPATALLNDRFAGSAWEGHNPLASHHGSYRPLRTLWGRANLPGKGA